MVSRQLRITASSLFEAAQEKSISVADLRGFRGLLEGEIERDTAAVNPDDLEWFVLFEHILEEIEDCNQGSDFGLPTDDWRSMGIQFEKLQKFYDELERTGAVEDVRWYHGGNGDVRATDLRPVEDYLYRQVQLRLRRMGLAPEDLEEEDLAARVWSWLTRHKDQILVGIILTLFGALVTFLLGLVGS